MSVSALLSTAVRNKAISHELPPLLLEYGEGSNMMTSGPVLI